MALIPNRSKSFSSPCKITKLYTNHKTGSSTSKFYNSSSNESWSKYVPPSSPSRLSKDYQRSHNTWVGVPYVNYTLRYVLKTNSTDVRSEVYSGTTAPRYLPLVNLIPPLQQSKDELINAAIKRIRDESVDLANFFGELNQTVSLIGRSASRIASAYRDIRRGHFQLAATNLGISKPRGSLRDKEWADSLLAFNYGIVPIVNDAIGAAKHLAKRASQLRIRGVARIYSDLLYQASGSLVVFNPSIEHEVKLNSSVEGNIRTQEQVVLEYELEDSFWREMSQLGLINLPRAAWNLIPYSFIVDQFVNISDLLGNLDFGLGMKFHDGSYTQGQFFKGSVKSHLSVSRFSNLYNYTHTPGSPDVTPADIMAMERIALGEGDIVTTLLFRSPLSVSNCITDIALLRQRF